MRAWLREPLLHFLAAGAAIFLLYRVVAGGEEGPREIVVSEARIEALHAAGFCHCDLKPNNILIGEKGAVKVIDLGQAAKQGTIKIGRASCRERV